MLGALYWTAVFLALLGGLCGNRAAWALLASAAFCLGARWAGLPFNVVLWLLVDAMVIAVIAAPLWPFVRARAWRWLFAAYRKEVAILALFAPMWAAYAMPEAAAYLVSTAAGTVQLLLTFTPAECRERWRATLRRRADWTRFDLMEARA